MLFDADTRQRYKKNNSGQVTAFFRQDTLGDMPIFCVNLQVSVFLS